jgi:hypothetical protein
MSDSRLSEIKGMLLNKIQAYRETQIIYVAAKLKISDYLYEQQRSTDELAELTKTHRESLYRLLRACTALGLYEEKNNVFMLKDAGRLLLTDHPDSIRAVAIIRGEEVNWKPWGELLYAVKTGESAFGKLFNMRRNIIRSAQCYKRSRRISLPFGSEK